MTMDECTPYHNGKVFFTAHAAFSLELEQSLQSVDARVSLPYWDYSVDDALYGREWLTKSPVFNKTWFGAANSPHAGHVLAEGRFAYLPVDRDRAAPEHNGYGRVDGRDQPGRRGVRHARGRRGVRARAPAEPARLPDREAGAERDEPRGA